MGNKPKAWIADAAARVQADQDAELLVAGMRAHGLQQCGSVIVATDAQGIRNYHNCDSGRVHVGGDKHMCGCGQTWSQYNNRGTLGPLTDVVDGNGPLTGKEGL